MNISIKKKVLNSKRIIVSSTSKSIEIIFAKKLSANYILIDSPGLSFDLLATFEIEQQ
jgi:hypothetical protein|tara:strand:+ start:2256 stop:2429 length:174 start_codon:yes stop_codon:yes gene_type:complete